MSGVLLGRVTEAVKGSIEEGEVSRLTELGLMVLTQCKCSVIAFYTEFFFRFVIDWLSRKSGAEQKAML